jgi:predicted ATPase
MFQGATIPARPAHFASIEAIVIERLHPLDGATRAVVELAALVVRDVDPALLAEALGASVAAVAASLERGRACHLLSWDPRTQRPRFAHALIRGAVRGQIEPTRCRRLHARLAEALERRPGGSARTFELAHYWWEAGVAARSRVYDERAGDAALVVNAFDAAVAHYRRAFAACERGSAARRRVAMKLTNVVLHEGEVAGGS